MRRRARLSVRGCESPDLMTPDRRPLADHEPGAARRMEAADDIVPMLGDADPAMRARAVRALGRTGPSTRAPSCRSCPTRRSSSRIRRQRALFGGHSLCRNDAGATLPTSSPSGTGTIPRPRRPGAAGRPGPARGLERVPALSGRRHQHSWRGLRAAITRRRRWAASGPAASQAMPVLESAAADPERYVRQAAAVTAADR